MQKYLVGFEYYEKVEMGLYHYNVYYGKATAYGGWFLMKLRDVHVGGWNDKWVAEVVSFVCRRRSEEQSECALLGGIGTAPRSSWESRVLCQGARGPGA